MLFIDFRGEFKGNLCAALTLYTTVTWPFPKGDRYIQVWLYFVQSQQKINTQRFNQNDF